MHSAIMKYRGHGLGARGTFYKKGPRGGWASVHADLVSPAIKTILLARQGEWKKKRAARKKVRAARKKARARKKPHHLSQWGGELTVNPYADLPHKEYLKYLWMEDMMSGSRLNRPALRN